MFFLDFPHEDPVARLMHYCSANAGLFESELPLQTAHSPMTSLQTAHSPMIWRFTIATLVLGLAACGTDAPAGPVAGTDTAPVGCSSDDECGDGESCVDSICVGPDAGIDAGDDIEPGECTTNADCPGLSLCIGGECFALPECFEESDCDDGSSCIGGVCIDEGCVGDLDCPSGFQCADARCVEEAECSADDDCPEGEHCCPERR